MHVLVGSVAEKKSKSINICVKQMSVEDLYRYQLQDICRINKTLCTSLPSERLHAA